MSGNTNTYTKDELMRFNVYRLKQIPVGVQYDNLRKFVSDEKTANLSTVVKKNVIPTYLKNRYGNITVSNTITRGMVPTGPTGPSGMLGYVPEKPKDVARRKLYVQKTETPADKINEEIRDLLSKLSDTNKEKIFAEFMQKEIPDECGQALINTIYEFAIDLQYINHLYAEIIFKLKDKNNTLYTTLVNKLIECACTPLDNGERTKRLRMGNVILIAEIYSKYQGVFKEQDLVTILNFMIDKTLSEDANRGDYLQMTCELLKKIIPMGSIQSSTVLDESIKRLQTISYNQQYDKRYRFMVQDIVEQYNSVRDDDDDDV